MPLPASVPTGTVTGRWYTPSGADAVGTVHFQLVEPIQVPDDPDGEVITAPVVKVLVTAGVLNVTLPAGDYHSRVRLENWYEEAKLIRVTAGQATNWPDAEPLEEEDSTSLVQAVRSVEGIFPDATGNIDLPDGGGGGVTDHGELTGLADDDHSQYLNEARADVRYYTKSQIDTTVSGINSDITSIEGSITSINADILALENTADEHDDRLVILEDARQVFPIEQLGLIAANDNPASFRDPSAMGTNGWFVAILVPAGRPITGCAVGVHAAGTIDAGGENGFAIYSAAGTQIGSTPTDNALFATGGVRTKALTSQIAAQPTDRIVYVELRREGWSVEPQFAFLQTANAAGLFDGGWPSGLRRSFIAGGTGHPASINPATHGSSSSGFMPFVGLY
jgi:hypothetical protein